ncbi:hypothetical protein V6N13_128073 [Hibiscus sabdariffa]
MRKARKDVNKQVSDVEEEVSTRRESAITTHGSLPLVPPHGSPRLATYTSSLANGFGTRFILPLQQGVHQHPPLHFQAAQFMNQDLQNPNQHDHIPAQIVYQGQDLLCKKLYNKEAACC